MGFSVSGATAIVFLGALIAFGSAYPAVVESTEAIADAQEQRMDRMLERVNTDITVLSAAYNGSSNTLTAEVANNGTTALAVGDVDILVNGTYRDRENATVAVVGASNSSLWLPGETVEVTVESVDATSGDTIRFKLITGPGVAVATEVSA